MEPKGHLENLIEKYLAGNCNEEEQALVEHFYLSQFKQPTGEIDPRKILRQKCGRISISV